MSRPLNRPEFYTYADYYAWPDSVRGELIGGEFYDMSAAPTSMHQRIVVVLSTQMETFFRGETCRTFVAPFDVRLTEPGQEEGEILNVVQPDVTLVCDRSKIDELGCLGAPDWIIEVLSAKTRKKDLTESVTCIRVIAFRSTGSSLRPSAPSLR